MKQKNACMNKDHSTKMSVPLFNLQNLISNLCNKTAAR